MIHAVTSAALSVFLTISPVAARVPAQADQIRQQQWMLDYLDIARVHKISTGAGIVVGLPDTGVDPHPDIVQRLLPGADLIGGGSNGHKDIDGHGTAMAGLIAGQGQPGGSGVLGIAPSAKILPIIVSGKTGNNINVGRGIELAIQQGARVVNVSSGGAKSLTLKRAVETAAQADVLVVAANGNTTKSLTTDYPAALPGVLAVGAIGRDGKRAAISVTGGNIALCAPGVDVVTTGRNGEYIITQGTSAATAVVSGAAALVRAKFPDLSAAEVMHRLTATADDIGPAGRDDQCGYGILNIVGALTSDVPPLTATGQASTAPSQPAAPTNPADTAPATAASSASGSTDSGVLVGAGVGAAAVAVILAFLTVRRRIRQR